MASDESRALERLGDELAHALDNLCRGRPGRARERVVCAMEEWDALASPSPDAGDPLVGALRKIAAHEEAVDEGCDRRCVLTMIDEANAALAAHRPEREWRAVGFDDGRARTHAVEWPTEQDARQHAESLRRSHERVEVQVREVGPWRDVTDGDA